MTKGRWVELKPQPQGSSIYAIGQGGGLVPQMPTPAKQWVAVDERDQVHGTVATDGLLVNASTGGGNTNNKWGQFLTEDAAKRWVEKQLAPMVFGVPAATWVYMVAP